MQSSRPSAAETERGTETDRGEGKPGESAVFPRGASVLSEATVARSQPLRATRSSLDALAEQLRSLGPANSLEQMLRLGELIHGILRAREGEKSPRASLRRIAAHPGVPFKVTTLWRAVSVYEMSLRLPHVPGVRELGISHLRAVIGLDPADQEQLLGCALREGWTKRQLEREVARRREGRRCRGRRPTPKVAAWTRELRRVLERSTELEGATSSVDEATREELRGLLTELEDKSRHLRESLFSATQSLPGSRDSSLNPSDLDSGALGSGALDSSAIDSSAVGTAPNTTATSCASG